MKYSKYHALLFSFSEKKFILKIECLKYFFYIFHKKSKLFPLSISLKTVLSLFNPRYIRSNGLYSSFKAILGLSMIFPNIQCDFLLYTLLFSLIILTEETNLKWLMKVNNVVYFVFIQMISVIPVDWRSMSLNSINTVNVLHFQLLEKKNLHLSDYFLSFNHVTPNSQSKSLVKLLKTSCKGFLQEHQL